MLDVRTLEFVGGAVVRIHVAVLVLAMLFLGKDGLRRVHLYDRIQEKRSDYGQILHYDIL